MINYKLLTPGPLTTTKTVKEEMMVDHCTWDDDYKQVTQFIRAELLKLAKVDDKKYTSVLMQGSGTFGVESALTCVVGQGKVLIVTNGAYGERMCKIAEYNSLNHISYAEEYDTIPEAKKIGEILDLNSDITHVAMVHCETTSGILNDIEAVSKEVKKRNKVFIVDAMSSFGGMDIDVKTLNIDVLISSANKCIQGVPGFSFIIIKREIIEEAEGNAKSLSLDLYDQYKNMEIDGKWRFTSPTHVVLAFAKAIKELKEEGGIVKRAERYRDNKNLLVERMKSLGFETYVREEYQSNFITTFLFPEDLKFSFAEMYGYVKRRGYAIYPGKLTKKDTFRIGNIGEIYKEDIEEIFNIFKDFMKTIKE